VNVTARII